MIRFVTFWSLGWRSRSEPLSSGHVNSPSQKGHQQNCQGLNPGPFSSLPAIFKFTRVDLTLLKITNTKIEVCPLRSNVFERIFRTSIMGRQDGCVRWKYPNNCLVVGLAEVTGPSMTLARKTHHGKAWLRMAGIPYTTPQTKRDRNL